MKINNINNNKTNFKGGLSPLSGALYTLSNNDMLNASFVDIFAMDTPRTIVETKYRGKQAGIEMGFREYTGTFIAEFSAIVFAKLFSNIISKKYKPEIKTNSSSWITNDGLDVLKEIYDKSDKSVAGFTKDILASTSGIKGDKRVFFSDIDKEKTTPIIDKISGLIADKNLGQKETKKALSNIQDEIIQIFGADNNVNIKGEMKEFSSNLSHILRDIVDSSRNIFFSNAKNGPDEIISKLKTTNKLRIGLAIPLSMAIAVSNQYINRYMTKKRTGIDNFVGENEYEKNVETKNETKKQKGLFLKKLASASIFTLMLTKVMGIKKPSDFISKLEFNGPATGGNAIKTIYGTLILGRIFASKDSTELRETNLRDYLGFLNWLVLGGFVSKGVGQILDPKQKELFNIQKEGKGIKHWLSDVSLKSQKEILAQGGNIKANLRKLNIAQIAGIGYSALMLGVLLPKLNIWLTRRNKNQNVEQKQFVAPNMQEFLNESKKLVTI